jgi:hypothetical protein
MHARGRGWPYRDAHGGDGLGAENLVIGPVARLARSQKNRSEEWEAGGNVMERSKHGAMRSGAWAKQLNKDRGNGTERAHMHRGPQTAMGTPSCQARAGHAQGHSKARGNTRPEAILLSMLAVQMHPAQPLNPCPTPTGAQQLHNACTRAHDQPQRPRPTTAAAALLQAPQGHGGRGDQHKNTTHTLEGEEEEEKNHNAVHGTDDVLRLLSFVSRLQLARRRAWCCFACLGSG